MSRRPIRRTEGPQRFQRCFMLLARGHALALQPWQRWWRWRHQLAAPLRRTRRQRFHENFRSGVKHIPAALFIAPDLRRNLLIPPRPKTKACSNRQFCKSSLHLHSPCVLVLKLVFIGVHSWLGRKRHAEPPGLQPQLQQRAFFVPAVQGFIARHDRHLPLALLPPQLHRERGAREMLDFLRPPDLATLNQAEDVRRVMNASSLRIGVREFHRRHAYVLNPRHITTGRNRTAIAQNREQIVLRFHRKEVLSSKQHPAENLQQDLALVLGAAVHSHLAPRRVVLQTRENPRLKQPRLRHSFFEHLLASVHFGMLHKEKPLWRPVLQSLLATRGDLHRRPAPPTPGPGQLSAPPPSSCRTGRACPSHESCATPPRAPAVYPPFAP